MKGSEVKTYEKVVCQKKGFKVHYHLIDQEGNVVKTMTHGSVPNWTK